MEPVKWLLNIGAAVGILILGGGLLCVVGLAVVAVFGFGFVIGAALFGSTFVGVISGTLTLLVALALIGGGFLS